MEKILVALGFKARPPTTVDGRPYYDAEIEAAKAARATLRSNAAFAERGAARAREESRNRIGSLIADREKTS